jgi:hypothetical protein
VNLAKNGIGSHPNLEKDLLNYLSVVAEIYGTVGLKLQVKQVDEEISFYLSYTNKLNR